MTFRHLLLSAAIAILAVAPSRAALVFSFTAPIQSAPDNSNIPYDATLTNTGTNTIDLIQSSHTLAGEMAGGLHLNDLFDVNAPVSLAPAGSANNADTATVTLFTVATNSSPPGLYPGTYTIEYTDTGDQSNTPAVTGLTSAQTFDVTVTPEPSTWAMMAVGLGGVMGLHRRRKKGMSSAPPVDCTPV